MTDTSMRNPAKEELTIPEGYTLFGSTHTSEDTILPQSAMMTSVGIEPTTSELDPPRSKDFSLPRVVP